MKDKEITKIKQIPKALPLLKEIISDYKNYSIVDEKNYSLEKVDLNITFENPWAIEFIDDNQAIITEKKGRLVYVDFENNTWNPLRER